MAARDLGLTSDSGEDEGECLESCNLAALGGGGEADAERFVRDLVLWTGEAEAACADFRLLGLKRNGKKKTYGKPNGKPVLSVVIFQTCFRSNLVTNKFKMWITCIYNNCIQSDF